MTDDARLMTPATVDEYWNAGHRVTVPLPGTPDCRILFDPSHKTVSLLTPLTGKEPDVTKMRNIGFSTAVDEGVVWGELRIDASEAHQVAFTMATTVANRLQQDNDSLANAVPHALDAYRHLLSKRQGLNDEQQRGLFGELHLLRHLVQVAGAEVAVDGWHGPLAEEHDFFFPSLHIEVKTTSGERRRHMIGSLTQLAQSPGTPLWLTSIQLTGGAVGAGQTLPQLVSQARADVGDERPKFDERLEGMGWLDEHAELYTDIWQLRSQPRCYEVAGEFPRITDALIGDHVPSKHLVTELAYRIDVTDIPFPAAPQVLTGFVETEGSPA